MDLYELTPLLLDPCPAFPGQEGLPYHGRGKCGRGPCLFKVACGERILCLLPRAPRRDDVDPASLGKVEAVAAEGPRQSFGAVDAVLCE
jgi:hypothetical protein